MKPAAERRTRLTRQGWWFVAAAVAVGAFGAAAGINLLLLVFGAMVSLVIAGVALSELALAGLRVRRVLPVSVFADTPYLMGIELENRKRRLPSFSIEIEDVVAAKPIEKRCYFLKLPAGRAQETAYRHTLARRGRHRLSGFRLATRFPFGLVERARHVAEAEEVIVYPALIAPPHLALRALPAHAPGALAAARSREGEFAGLRAFRAGDDVRAIHWRTSARRGAWLVREHEHEQAHEVAVVLEGARGSAGEAAFERAVSEAAGACVELARRGLSVALVAPGVDIQAGAGRGHVARLLAALALVDATAARPPPRRSVGAILRIRPGAAPALEPAATHARSALATEAPQADHGGTAR